MESLQVERWGWGLLGYSKGVQTGRAHLYATRSHSPALPGFCHIYKYIHKYITYNSGPGRQASHREAQLTELCLRILGRAPGLPEMCSMCSLLPRVYPAQEPTLSFSGSSLSSMESCRRWVWRLETWAAGSWAGCADQSHSGHPAVGGGAAAGSGAAGGPA